VSQFGSSCSSVLVLFDLIVSVCARSSPLSPSYYKYSVLYRFAAIAALSAASVFAQSDVPALQGDPNDPMVVRAQEDLQRVRKLINEGALPAMRLKKAEDAVEDALDMSILRQSLYSKDLLPEQADQMVSVAQKMVVRRQRSMMEIQQLVSTGVLARSEAEATDADFERAQTELSLAQSRARLLQQMAESLRIEKGIASLETQAESHPEWSGSVFTKYDGNGVFNPGDLQKISGAFLGKFARPLPISAEGETALHRSLGFDHRGRVDVAVNPDQPQGVWLKRYLE
jgi:hypothetical protein